MGSKDHSFDVVSEVNFMELDNAVVQVRKELQQRFDFKGSMASIDLDQKEKKITLKAENDYKLKALADMLQLKCGKRGVSLRALDFGKVETGHVGGSVLQVVAVQSGIPSDKAKEIVKAIKDAKMKGIQPSIQSDQIRVQSSKIDDLQQAISFLKGTDFGLDLQFVNYR
jgi:cyclic-di-GMP-binding protein